MSTRILQVCLSPNLGGLELYMQRLSLYLQPHTPTHICVAQNSKLSEMLSDSPEFPQLQLQKSSWKNIFRNAKKLANYIDKHSINVLHMHWTKDLPLCVFAKQLSKQKPRLIQSRHMNMTRFKGDFYHRYLYRNIDLMIAVTEQVKQQITRYVPKDICPKVHVSYIGAPPYQPLNQESQQALRQQYNLEDYFVITLAGRIEPAKGQALLIDALQQLKNKKTKVLFIGDAMKAEYLEQLQTSITEKDLASQVTFTGFVNNVQDLMAISDCVVLTTDKETFGMVLIEAMHTGTAVIASKSGGPLEIIEHNKDGLLFNSGNAQDLAKQLTHYIENPVSRQQLSGTGKTTAVSKFDSARQFDEVLKLLTTPYI